MVRGQETWVSFLKVFQFWVVRVEKTFFWKSGSHIFKEAIRRSANRQIGCGSEQKEFKPRVISSRKLPGKKKLAIGCLDIMGWEADQVFVYRLYYDSEEPVFKSILQNLSCFHQRPGETYHQ